MTRVVIPTIHEIVDSHYEMASAAISAMSPSRSYGSVIDVNCWRRVLTWIEPDGTDGHAFVGHTVQSNAELELPVGALVVAVDSCWAKANWYAGQYIAPLEKVARVLRVDDAHLIEQFFSDSSRTWARDVLGYLMTNRDLLEAANVSIGGAARNVQASAAR